MMIGGIYLGFATETFRRAAMTWKSNLILSYVFEICFWITQTCILFFVLYNVNEGELRFFIFLACLLGFSIYTVLFKTMYKRLLEFFIKIMKTTIKWTIQTINVLIIHPIKWTVQMIIAILLYVVHVCRHLLFFLFKILFYPIKLLINVMKIILPEKVVKNITSMATFCSTIIYKLKKWLKKVFLKRR